MWNLRAVFDFICKAGLNLTVQWFHFGVREVELLSRTIEPERVSRKAQEIQNFLNKLRFPK